MLIEETKEGRKDGAYTRLFGNKELGSLISRVHIASISAGTELEKIIESKCVVLDDINRFIDKELSEGQTYLIVKKGIKKSSLKSDKEPDFLVVKMEREHCYIIELKDSDNFDTKKSAAEKDNLETFQNHISKKISFTSSIHICCFNQEDKSKIKEGLNGTFETEEIMTGKELCALLEINYPEIIEQRQKDQTKNVEFFKTNIRKILGIDLS